MRRAIIAAGALCVAALSPAKTADAASGIFPLNGVGVPPTMTQQRIVVAFLDTETVIWDQVVFSGTPADFAWVIPVTGETAVDLGASPFLDTLDLATQPDLVPPQSVTCANAPSGSVAVDGGDASPPADAAVPPNLVQPTDMTVLTAGGGATIASWLASNGYVAAGAGQTALQSYVSRNVDFIAMRMLPIAGEQATRPVRIHLPPGVASLALPMMLAGMGSTVDVQIWLTGRDGLVPTSNDAPLVEQPSNYALATIDFGAIVWDWDTNTTNYASVLTQTVQATAGGHAFVREFLERAASINSYFPILSAAPDSGYPDASTDDSADDWARATEYYASGFWLTRLRSTLTSAVLDTDMQFAPATTMAVSNSYQINQQVGDGPNGDCRGGVSLGGGGGNGISCDAAPPTTNAWPRAAALFALLSTIALIAIRRRTRRD